MKKEATKKVKTCSICFEEYKGYGNNAQPINDGRCCDSCNGQVIMARITMMNSRG